MDRRYSRQEQSVRTQQMLDGLEIFCPKCRVAPGVLCVEPGGYSGVHMSRAVQSTAYQKRLVKAIELRQRLNAH